MSYQLEQISKELQTKIAEINADVNSTIYPDSPQELRLAILPDLRPDIIHGEVSVLKPHFVYFRLERQVGHLGRYVFDRFE